MFTIRDVLTLERTRYALPLQTKKQTLEAIAEVVSQDISFLERDLLFDKLLQRERLGSTAIGHHAAIPHARLPQIALPIGCFISLKDGSPFDAPHDEKVQWLFSILLPQEANEVHLQLLTHIKAFFDNAGFREDLQKATSQEALYRHWMSYSK